MEKDILGAVINEPKLLKEITLEAESWFQRLLQKLKLSKPITIPLILKSPTFRTAHKLAQVIGDINLKSELTGQDGDFDILEQNIHKMALILAIALHNSNKVMPDNLLDIVLDNFDMEELPHLVAEVYRRLDIQNFFGSMGLLKELRILNDTQGTEAYQLSSDQQN